MFYPTYYEEIILLQNGYDRIIVSDNGIGIKKSDLKFIGKTLTHSFNFSIFL